MALQEQTSRESLGLLKQLVTISNDQALDAIRRGYELPLGDTRLYFHTRPHTRGIIRRSRLIGEVVHGAVPEEVSETDVEVTVFGAGRHDEIQISKSMEVVISDRFGEEWHMVKRQRATGENETASAAIAQEFAVRELLPRNLISQQQLDDVLKGIELTKPDFNKELHTVIQPGFADDTNPFIAQAIALADLAATGMHGSEVAKYEAAALFWEDFMSIRRYKEALQADDMRRETRIDVLKIEAFYKEQLLTWLGQQIKFIQGRQQLVWGEIDSLHISAPGKKAVRNLFSNDNFDNAVRAVGKLQNELFDQDFVTCTRRIDQLVTTIPAVLQ